MITYQDETYDSCIDEIKPLFFKHWEEIAGNKDVIALEPDFDKYKQIEENGMLRIFSARDDGDLIGYFICFVSPHIHYKSTIYAFNDIMYVKPSYRGSTVGYRLIKNAMTDLKENCAVDMLVIHMKVEHEFRKLLNHLGFALAEENWQRLL
jgi:GNAT superfamily N-acetyltransferase